MTKPSQACLHATETHASACTWSRARLRRLARQRADRENSVPVRAGLAVDLDLHAESLLERRAEERLAPLRGIPARPLGAHEPHDELAEALRLHLDAHANDLGTVGHTPTDHSTHPHRD